MKNILWMISLLVGLHLLSNSVSAQSLEIKSRPLYDQCASLTTGKATDDAVSKAIGALAEGDIGVRVEAIRQLGKSCDKRATEPLVDLLKAENLDIRIAAIEALGKLGDPESVNFLTDIVWDRDWRIRLALISTLASFKTFQAKNMVVNGIANPSGEDITDIDDMRVRCSAILTMNQLKDVSHSRKSLLFLKLFLESSHPPIREMAEKTLYLLKDTRNGPTELMALVKQSNDPHLRKWVIEWLGKLKVDRARDLLQTVATDDNDEKVREAAKEALKSINAEDKSM